MKDVELEGASSRLVWLGIILAVDRLLASESRRLCLSCILQTVYIQDCFDGPFSENRSASRMGASRKAERI